MKPLKFSGTHQFDETRIAFHLGADKDILQRSEELLFITISLGHEITPELVKGPACGVMVEISALQGSIPE